MFPFLLVYNFPITLDWLSGPFDLIFRWSCFSQNRTDKAFHRIIAVNEATPNRPIIIWLVVGSPPYF